jgi:hypothetical protein
MKDRDWVIEEVRRRSQIVEDRKRLPYAKALIRALQRRGYIVEDRGGDTIILVDGDVVVRLDLVGQIRILGGGATEDILAALEEIGADDDRGDA